jgi:hypothetical protein
MRFLRTLFDSFCEAIAMRNEWYRKHGRSIGE